MGRPKAPDRSGQLSLFGDTSAVGRSRSVHAGRLRFVDPNPSKILIGSELLGDFLKRVGEERVFEIRDLLQGLDWSRFESRYKAGGRPPYHPRLTLSIVLFGVMNGVSSLRKLENFARTNLACWWLSGGIMPDHDTLADVLNRFAEDLESGFFEELTTQILAKTGSRCDDLAGDGTVVEAATSRYRGLKLEAAQAALEEAQRRCEAQPESPKRQRELAQAKRVQKVAEERSEKRVRKGKAAYVRVSPTEPEAVYQSSKVPATASTKAFAYSYKPSILANHDRLILAQSVHPSSEVTQVKGLLEQANRVTPEVSRLMLDAGFFSGEVAGLAARQDLDLLCPEGKDPARTSAPKAKKRRFPKERFEYDAESDSYLCPAGKRLHRLWTSKREEGTPIQYGGAPCRSCPLRPQCTASKKRGRTITRSLPADEEEALDACREVMKHPKAIEAYRARAGMVEPVFAEMRAIGLSRFARFGGAGARLEFALRSIAHNLRRFLALIGALLERWLLERIHRFSQLRPRPTTRPRRSRHGLLAAA